MRWRRSRSHFASAKGFTLVDLAAVGGASVALAILWIPSLAKTARSGEAAVCLSNLRQLSRASQMYAADSRDEFPGAYHGGFVPAATSTERPWATGWLDWTDRPDNTNTVYVTTPRYACLSPYLTQDPRVIKCPADVYVSAPQRQRGWGERVRSVSVSVGVGEGNAETGPWEHGVFHHVRRITEIVYPAPAETWLFLDEHPDSINDPCFQLPRKTVWIDVPASHHNGAGGVTFIDGHTEMHAWHGSTRIPVQFRFVAPASVEAQDVDWLRYHTPRLRDTY